MLHSKSKETLITVTTDGACGVMVIVKGNGHDDTSSKPGRDW